MILKMGEKSSIFIKLTYKSLKCYIELENVQADKLLVKL
jgi:hypothetical protein